MRVLLISDTHRQIAPVNHLAAENAADCCFHLGDFCTYTRKSVDSFSADMLYKQLKHTPQLPPEEFALIDPEDSEAMRSMALKYRTYGDFEDFLTGKKHLDIPVYGIPGNNDDADVIAYLEKHPIPNLLFLNEKKVLRLEGFLICGICGTSIFTPSCNHESTETEQQIAELERQFLNKHPQHRIIFLFHVPPYENQHLMRLVEAVNPSLVLCGHTHHWDERTVGACRILTLPRIDRGYALLELNGNNWKYETFKAMDKTNEQKNCN